MGGESVKGFGTEWVEGGVRSGRCCRGCLLSECSIDACASASQVLVFSILLCIRSVQLHRNVQLHRFIAGMCSYIDSCGEHLTHIRTSVARAEALRPEPVYPPVERRGPHVAGHAKGTGTSPMSASIIA